MWEGAIAVQISFIVLTLIQACLAGVLGWRMYHRDAKLVEGRPITTKMLLSHRMLNFAVTFIQLLRCVDPFAANGIWPYLFCRILQAFVTAFIFFQFVTLSFVLMDTLYACALRQTPISLAWSAVILPLSQFIVSFTVLGLEPRSSTAWPRALNNAFGACVVLGNWIAYIICGCNLIYVLKRHRKLTSGVDESRDSSGSKTDTLAKVIRKTTVSMATVTVFCAAVFAVLMSTVPGLVNAPPLPEWSADVKPELSGLEVLFMQIAVEFLFTKLTWLSKEQLEEQKEKAQGARASAGTGSAAQNPEPAESTRRTTNTATRSEIMERAKKLSQVPTPTTLSKEGESEGETFNLDGSSTPQAEQGAIVEISVSDVDTNKDVSTTEQLALP